MRNTDKYRWVASCICTEEHERGSSRESCKHRTKSIEKGIQSQLDKGAEPEHIRTQLDRNSWSCDVIIAFRQEEK